MLGARSIAGRCRCGRSGALAHAGPTGAHRWSRRGRTRRSLPRYSRRPSIRRGDRKSARRSWRLVVSPAVAAFWLAIERLTALPARIRNLVRGWGAGQGQVLISLNRYLRANLRANLLLADFLIKLLVPRLGIREVHVERF